jgi:hypothetical protein
MLYDKHIQSLTKELNRHINKIGYSFTINHKHVKQRLNERQIDIIDFIHAMREVQFKICQMVYYTSIEKPFYTFEYRTDNVILMIGFSDSTNKKFVLRTVLNPKIHNKHNDETVYKNIIKL